MRRLSHAVSALRRGSRDVSRDVRGGGGGASRAVASFWATFSFSDPAPAPDASPRGARFTRAWEGLRAGPNAFLPIFGRERGVASAAPDAPATGRAPSDEQCQLEALGGDAGPTSNGRAHSRSAAAPQVVLGGAAGRMVSGGSSDAAGAAPRAPPGRSSVHSKLAALEAIAARAVMLSHLSAPQPTGRSACPCARSA